MKTNCTFITKKSVNALLGGEDAFDCGNNAKFLNTVRNIRKNAFAKSLQATLSAVMSVRPSVRPPVRTKISASTGRIFVKFYV
jgi:hypothetical protein